MHLAVFSYTAAFMLLYHYNSTWGVAAQSGHLLELHAAAAGSPAGQLPRVLVEATLMLCTLHAATLLLPLHSWLLRLCLLQLRSLCWTLET